MLQLKFFKVIGHSMEPKIEHGDIVLASNIFYLFKKPRINDIVSFRKKDKILLKRITRIDEGKYFLEGDNKNDSLDSRKFGHISKEQILGKVVIKI